MAIQAVPVEWKQRRKEALDHARRVVIKVGSAVLTRDFGLDLRAVNRLADQIGALSDAGKEVVLVSSGAVAAGRKALEAARRQVNDGSLPVKQAVAAVGQSRLMHEYDDAFARYNKITAQMLLTRDDFTSRKRFLHARHTVRMLLSWGVIPIINENDSVGVDELTMGDNDQLASMVLGLVEADLFVNLTSADGVFTENPAENPKAQCLRCIDDINALDIDGMCAGKTPVGSGGMASKLRAAKRASQLAVPTAIISGREPFSLEHLFDGEDVGTWVVPDEHAISTRKFWMAYNTDPSGEIWIDQGAARAVVEQGKSLLPVGITRVDGRFGKGALIRVLDFQGQPLGVGLSNYSKRELTMIMGRNSAQIERVLGSSAYPEAVHRDNLLLDAAI